MDSDKGDAFRDFESAANNLESTLADVPSDSTQEEFKAACHDLLVIIRNKEAGELLRTDIQVALIDIHSSANEQWHKIIAARYESGPKSGDPLLELRDEASKLRAMNTTHPLEELEKAFPHLTIQLAPYRAELKKLNEGYIVLTNTNKDTLDIAERYKVPTIPAGRYSWAEPRLLELVKNKVRGLADKVAENYSPPK